jgi:Flp pilus assembly pilin Flp
MFIKARCQGSTLTAWLKREEGQDLTEYSLVVFLIVLVVLVNIPPIGAYVTNIWGQIAAAF